MKYKPTLSIKELSILEHKRQKAKDTLKKPNNLDDVKNKKLTLSGTCGYKRDCEECPDRFICFEYNQELFISKKKQEQLKLIIP